MKALEILGKENVPNTGALVIPSVLGASDLAHLERLLSQRRVAFLVEEGRPLPPGIAEALGRGDVTTLGMPAGGPVGDDVRAAVAAEVQAGGLVVFVPAAANLRPSSLMAVPGPVIDRLAALGVPILPLLVDHPREFALSIEPPRQNPETTFSFGRMVDAGGGQAASAPALVLEELLLAREVSYRRRPLFDGSLTRAIVLGLRKHGSRAKVIDGLDGGELRFDRLLAAAIALSKVIRQESDKPRVGVILPPGKGVFLANVAALLAGKTPVNINFTAGHKAVESAMRQADLDRFITADPFVRKMQGFPWPPNRQLLFLERTLPQIKGSIIRWLIVSKLLPASALAGLLRLPLKGGREEALLLFTSGSSGEPKGVVLSHRNILGNVSQFAARLGLGSQESILGSLPLFHSFGCTVTMWYPILEGLSVVTYPSPIDATKLAPLIEQHGVSLLVSTPTFLRGYMRRVKKEQLAGVRYIVSGAEKLPRQFAEAFHERFGKEIFEGYGLTETSPVTNVNLPDPPAAVEGAVIPANRPGSVGQLMPGLAVRITDPDQENPIPVDQSGIIWFKGVNIFEGYLNNPGKNKEVLQDGWFRTGDIGRLDHDGFLHIEGRLSRFSKIGGEMVPHETVEAHIADALGLHNEEERRIAVVGIPDDQKGEQLVLLSTVAGETITQELIELRYTLLEKGVPALWIPRHLIRIDDIPVLASGKLDLRRCEQIALRVSED